MHDWKGIGAQGLWGPQTLMLWVRVALKSEGSNFGVVCGLLPGAGASFLTVFLSVLSEIWFPLPACGYSLSPHSPTYLPTSLKSLTLLPLSGFPQPQHPLPSSVVEAINSFSPTT